MNTYIHISEVSLAGKKAVERDKGKIDIAAAAESSGDGGMGFAGVEEDQCESSEQVICAM
ncbi:MAG TPA: hypothetical protein VNU92_18105 [Edaphobacter sp.]|jgi:hypothetical protein|nr:hypothetical protein [Edaphobacter sp.]